GPAGSDLGSWLPPAVARLHRDLQSDPGVGGAGYGGQRHARHQLRVPESPTRGVLGPRCAGTMADIHSGSDGARGTGLGADDLALDAAQRSAQDPWKSVGVTGFEPATSSSRTTRATNLRHTPWPCAGRC